MRDNAVERLFSLFTSSDRAVAIAGDLAEEREQRGWIWFWLHVVGVTFALWRSAAAEAPLRVLALTLTGGALFTAPAIAGVAAVYLFPVSTHWLSWIALSFFWWGGAVWTGASLVTIAPQRGMPACAIAAVVGAALLLAFGVTIEPHEFSRTDRMFFTTALGATVALLAGGAIARRRTIVIAVPFAVAIGLATTMIFLMAGTSSPSAESKEWRDPAPHVVKFLPVESEVQLEVLDWGGSGPTLILLAGLGDTGHVFDDFAPMLTPRYRVLAVTRRAHGRSSAPPTGYGFARLAEDVVRVIDGTRVGKPVVIGHSFAGEELHVLGARHSDKIAGLVYIDAAFNRGDDSDNEAYNAVAKTLPAVPDPGPHDLASFTALRSFLEKTQGALFPESHLRARYVANSDGTVDRMWAPDPSIRQAMSKEMQAAYKPYNPARIRVPALAIYAVPKSAANRMRPWYAVDDPGLRERVEKLYGLERDRVGNHSKWFQRFAEQGRVAEVSGAHHLFISNPREVLEHIDAFVSTLRENADAAR